MVSCAALGPAQTCSFPVLSLTLAPSAVTGISSRKWPAEHLKRLAVASQLLCMHLIWALLRLQGMLKRLAAATQPFSFSEIAESAEVAHRIAHSTANTGTYQDLLRAAVASIVRPSSR